MTSTHTPTATPTPTQPSSILVRHFAEPTHLQPSDVSPSMSSSSPLPAGIAFAPSAERNKRPIAEALSRHWSGRGAFLEVSSGTGQHVSFFAQRWPDASFQPTDQSDEAFKSIAYHSRECKNVQPPLILDLLHDPSKWTFERSSYSVVHVANMLHISDPGTTEGLFKVASLALQHPDVDNYKPILAAYGPFKLHGEFTTDSNRAFDDKLKGMNPVYGLRDIDDVSRVGKQYGFELMKVEEMPSNNFMLIYRYLSPQSA